jgi:hypothetical protein
LRQGLREATLLRKLNFVSCCAVLVLAFSMSLCSQDSQDQPSLGDVARQARSQKNTATSQKVITNDDISSNPGFGVSGMGQTSGSKATANSVGNESSSQDLDKVESAIAKMDKMDRATLVKLALQDTNVNFPGRPAWETRLVAAKEDYVAQLRDLTRAARAIEASAKALVAAHSGQIQPSENDPDMLQLKARLKDLVQNAEHIDAAFQAVVLEGRNRALEVSSH